MEHNRNDNKAFSKNLQLVTFTLGDEEYGVYIEGVQEVIRMPGITHLPQTEQYIKGVINLRGLVIPVIDMRERFNMTAKNYTDTTRVIVVKIKENFVGLIVDTVSQVIVLNQEDIEEAPDIIRGLSKEYIAGIGKLNEDMIIILKIEEVLTAEEIKKLNKATETAAENMAKTA